MESEWDKGFKAGFEMCLKLEKKRIENVENVLITMASWIAQSANAPLRHEEVLELEKMLKGVKK